MRWLPTLCLTAFLMLTISTSQAALLVTVNEIGGSLVINGSGTANLNGLTPGATTTFPGPNIHAADGVFFLGLSAPSNVDTYSILAGPTQFGPGALETFPFGTGDIFGISPNSNTLSLPGGYISGTTLSNTTTIPSPFGTLSAFGLTPGTYVWTWGADENADSLTLQINAAVPTPSAFLLMGTGLLGLIGYRKWSTNKR